MSQERFIWLEEIGAEVIATPGSESNVKEIYDKCWEIRKTREDCIIFNQFDEFGNSAWHYTVTGSAVEEIYQQVKEPDSQLTAFISSSGSAGTIATGDYLRTVFPQIKVVVSEALQCPTLLMNGFGEHQIEGIGDKHVPWIHNIKNTNMVTAINDDDCMRILRLFNEKTGQGILASNRIDKAVIDQLPVLGISSIANILSAIKTAKYYECTNQDIIFTIATDSADLYASRVVELREQHGEYLEMQAAVDFERCILGAVTDNLKELTYRDQKTIHNLKYYTWIEQQEKDVQDLNALWYDREIWQKLFTQPDRWDEMIDEFNEISGAYNSL